MTTGGTLLVQGPTPLRGRVRVPGDKSISHRALLLAALADGGSAITGLSTGEDVAHTLAAVRALGATVDRIGQPGDPDDAVVVTGGHLRAPDGPIDVGNSGTGLRLLMGVTAGLGGTARFDGDESIRRRPMDRVAVPLRLMGAAVAGSGETCRAPLSVTGGDLCGIDYTLPVASAQVKGAVLLAGLAATGDTVVREATPTRAHTEEMLAAFGAEVSVDGGAVRLRPGRLTATDVVVPGDPSQAAFWLVAATVVPGSDITVEGIYLGPARSGFLDVLLRMGADLDIDETTGDVRARHAHLTGTDVNPEEIPGLVDEVPALAVAAAVAEGRTRFLGAGELRVKESDRIATVASELGALGAMIEPTPEGLVITGGAGLRAGRVTSHGDHRIAMASAVAALAADGVTEIDGWDVVATSYPGFEQDLESLRG